MRERRGRTSLRSDTGRPAGGALKRAVAAVRRTEPTYANARRVWSRYSSAVKDDLALARLVCNAASPESCSIDGMTEVLSCQDLFEVLQMPNCLTLELQAPGCPEGPPRAFLMVPFATRSAESIEAFRNYFLGTVFDPSRLRYASRVDESTFQDALSQGNLVYLSEFVSPNSSAATMALLIAAHAIIVRVFKVPNCVVLGKCLDAVCLAGYRNEFGNQPIKRLAASFKLSKIGEATQYRGLNLPQGQQTSGAAANSTSLEEAELLFGLYMGNAARMASLVAQYEDYLHDSLFKEIEKR